MDFDLTGQFWGMPVNFTGKIISNLATGYPGDISATLPGNISITIADPMAATPSYIPFLAALAGALLGGLITFTTTYAKSKAEMRWGLKQNALMVLIDGLDQSGPRLPAENKDIRRRAKNLIRIAFKDEKIKRAANKITDSNGLTLKELQSIFDDELMPLVEKDLEKTMQSWWQFWR